MDKIKSNEKRKEYLRLTETIDFDYREELLGSQHRVKTIKSRNIFKKINCPHFMKRNKRRNKEHQRWLRRNLLEKKHFLSDITGSPH